MEQKFSGMQFSKIWINLAKISSFRKFCKKRLFHSIEEISRSSNWSFWWNGKPPYNSSFPLTPAPVLLLERSLQVKIKTFCITITSLQLTFVHKCISSNSKIIFRRPLNGPYLQNFSYKKGEDMFYWLPVFQELESFLKNTCKIGRLIQPSQEKFLRG